MEAKATSSAAALATAGFRFALGAATVSCPAFSVATGEDAVLAAPSVLAGDRAARCLAGLDAPASGAIDLFGRRLADTSPRELLVLRRRLAIAPFDPAFLSTVPVPDNVAIPLRDRRDLSDDELLARALARLADLGVEIVGRVLPGALNRPERWLAGFARASLAEADLLVVCEPPLALSEDQFRRFVRALDAIRSERRTALVLVSAENLNARRGFANIVNLSLETPSPRDAGQPLREGREG